jgi:hypothetical protein
MKATVIVATTTKEFEQQLNAWLEAYPKREIKFVTQSESDAPPSVGGWTITYTILYKNVG